MKDADRDGDLDVILGQGASVLVLANDGHGRFVRHDIDRRNSAAQMDVVANHFNGDNHIDFVLGSPPASSNPVVILVSRPDGTYREESGSRFPTGMPAGRPLAWEDFTGDGHGDLLILGQTGSLHLMAATASGSFVDVTQRSIPSTLPPGGFELRTPAAVADFDGDNDLDVHIPNRARDPLLVNDGQGRFSLSSYLAYVEPTMESFFEDFDRDGDLDLFALGGPGQADHRLFLNQGSGRLVRHTWTLRASTAGDTWAGIGDLTGDGYPEVILRSFGPPGFAMRILSLGPGLAYRDITTEFLPPHTASPAPTLLADFDRDGDLDILSFAVNRQAALMFANTRTQTIAPMASPIGKATFVSTYGPAGTSTVTAVSAASTVTPLGSLGDLRLDPRGLLIPFAGNIGTSRELKFPFAVPDNPWLRGKKLWFQSLHLAPNRPRLTNSTWTIFP